MVDKIDIHDVHDKNINFLFGSGASYGLFPTLAVKIKGNDGTDQTIETLASHFEETGNTQLKTLLFMHYYKECIEPAIDFSLTSGTAEIKKQRVVENYKEFIEQLVVILQRKKVNHKRCNVFTTNYDGCFEHVCDELQKQGNINFILNDGSRGFISRSLQAKNFNSFTYESGVFERHKVDIPQINLIHIHGSIYWHKDNDNIRVDYSTQSKHHLELDNTEILNSFSDLLLDEEKAIDDLAVYEIPEKESDQFWSKYQSLPIVNPTKWKFHETVFEEHYYQMLRLLSYELEKPNSVFITFGFSFADEHILNLVKRSLSNPSLKVFVCCFDKDEATKMEKHFKSNKNIELVVLEEKLDFTAFNEKVFNASPKISQRKRLEDLLK